MKNNPGRGFTLVDAMAFVAATAAGLAWIRSNYDWRSLSRMWWYYYSKNDFLGTVSYSIRFIWPLLLTWTLTTLALEFRRGRSRRRMLTRQPGLVACCAATLATALIFWPTLIGLLAGIPGFDSKTGGPSIFWEGIATGNGGTEAIGLAVATAWLTMALSRRWHPEPTWTDRLGRILGVCWIVLFLACGLLRAGFILRE